MQEVYKWRNSILPGSDFISSSARLSLVGGVCRWRKVLLKDWVGVGVGIGLGVLDRSRCPSKGKRRKERNGKKVGRYSTGDPGVGGAGRLGREGGGLAEAEIEIKIKVVAEAEAEAGAEA